MLYVKIFGIMLLDLINFLGIFMYIQLFLTIALALLGIMLLAINLTKYIKKLPDRLSETMWYFVKFRIAEFAIAIGIISVKGILEFLIA